MINYLKSRVQQNELVYSQVKKNEQDDVNDRQSDRKNITFFIYYIKYGGICKKFLVHLTSAYLLEKKAFHPLDEIRADTKVRPPHPGPLPGGEGIRGLITPANLIEQRPDMLEKKYALVE